MNDVILIIISMYVMIIANLIPINILAFENAYEYKGILIALNIIIFTLLTIIGFVAVTSNKDNKKTVSKDKSNITYNTTVNYNTKNQLEERTRYLNDIDDYKGLDKWV